MRVIAYTQKCIASGACVLACSQVFGQRDEDGVIQVLDEHPSLDLIGRVRKAVDLCPALVFSIEDEENTSDLTVVEDDREI